MPRPDLARVPQFYHRYINHVEQNDLNAAFDAQTSAFIDFLQKLPAEKHDYRYADGKWTIKEVIQHIIDAERIFSYRALCFARKDQTSLPSFDENDYADNAKADKRKWNDLIEEFRTVRHASTILFHSFDEEQLDSTGIANKNPVYVSAIGFIMVGHVTHHWKVINERYL
jgi:hypothetical protein